jgi:protein phosphatase
MGLRIAEKAALTDVGRQRQSNEDSYLERSPLFAVADGMGGARAGEVASRIAVEAFDEHDDAGGSAEERLADVARSANRQIYSMAQEDAALAGMGTTLVAAYVTGREVAVGHVGDSRLYRLRGGQLERLTQDHSLVEEFVRQGKLTPEEAEVHPQRSIITRALGPEPEVEVDTYTYAGRDGDVYLICSDGLTGMISEEDVADIVGRNESLEDAAKELIEAANENGGKDNITVVMFRLASDGQDDEDPDTLGGQATDAEGGLSSDTVRAAVAEAERTSTRSRPDPDVGAPTVEREQPRKSDVTGGVPVTSPLAHRNRRHRWSTRTKVTTVLVLLAIAAVLVGLYAGSRQFWFIGTNGRAQVTLYRGLPYELPFGIHLYTQQYVSKVPAAAITNGRQRKNDLDQQLRSQGDARDLVRSLERQYATGR